MSAEGSKEIIVRKMKFVSLGNLKSELGLNKTSMLEDVISTQEIKIEQTTVFSLQEIRAATDAKLDEHAKASKLSKADLVTACISTLLATGSARNKLNSTMFVHFANNSEKYEKLSMDKDGVADISPIFREIEEIAKSKYDGIKMTKNSANGGKLFLRCYANQSYVFLEKIAKTEFSRYLKIAQKTAIKSNTLALLCNPAFPDIKEVTARDAKAFLRIMANYMKRSRAGKSTKDVNDDAINKKDIFLSLASRLFISHPTAGMLNNSELDTIWEEGKLPNESDPDLGSTYWSGGQVRTLKQLSTGKLSYTSGTSDPGDVD